MIIGKTSGFLLIGRAIKDAEVRTSTSGNTFTRIAFRVDTKPAEDGTGKYEGQVVSVSAWGDLGEAAAHIQKFDRLQVLTHQVEKKPKDGGGFFYNATAEALFPSMEVLARMIQTYANTAPVPVTSAPAASAVFDPALSAPLDESDDLPF